MFFWEWLFEFLFFSRAVVVIFFQMNVALCVSVWQLCNAQLWLVFPVVRAAGVTLKIITLWCLRCVLVNWQVITPATRRGNRSLLCIFRFVVVSCSHFTVLHAREVLCRLNDRPCPLMLPYFLGLMISIFLNKYKFVCSISSKRLEYQTDVILWY